MFDIDGVIGRGPERLPGCAATFRLLHDAGTQAVPYLFVSNDVDKNEDKAAEVQKWIERKVSNQH